VIITKKALETNNLSKPEAIARDKMVVSGQWPVVSNVAEESSSRWRGDENLKSEISNLKCFRYRAGHIGSN
jgi:hypothetical protein